MDKELLEIFSNIIPDLSKILAERTVDMEVKKREINGIFHRYKESSLIDRLIVEDAIRYYRIPELIKIGRDIARLEKLIKLVKGERVKELPVNRRDIEYAKQMPIEQFVPFDVKKAGIKLYKALCPFHNEKTPSFTIYTDTNQYHCYGCGAHGNVINFIMEYYSYDFVEAVRFLLNK